MAKGKELKRVMKLELEAGKANPARIGKDLAPTGINLMQFCSQYNELTKGKIGQVVPAEIKIYEDRSFEILLKTPPASFLLKQYAGISKGSATPGKAVAGSITTEQLREIAKIKLPDLNTTDVESAMRIIAGTAKNMGILVED
jgi:large subunit ribosomal protein L11